ncbi:MAG: glycosyltransferase family A protein [Vibrio ordalii]|uniref:glycosyltransferase family A protein n=1 Tax=Vibrio ordalii TaxID=28174 RepID=UPI003F2DF232
MKLVSIIIPIKNPGSIFERVFESVVTQIVDFEYDVIIVDSGSTDGSIDFIKSYDGNVKVNLLKIQPSEFGHGKTRNYAISHSNSKYCAILTHDATPFNQYWLYEAVSLAESDDDIAGVFGRHIAYENANYFTKRELRLHFDGFIGNEIVKLDDELRYQNETGYKQFLHFFSDNNALIRRSIWQKIPYPDVDFAEDQLWAKSIIEAGYKKAYADNAIVFHSHDYNLIERLQRSFDESNAFYRLFGYDIMPNIITMIKVWIGITRTELIDAIKSKQEEVNFFPLARQPIYNFMKYFGMYLGVHNKLISTRLLEKLSYDKKLYKGLRKGDE